ncbi:MAG: RHS repeat-associated core domain-containing protein, partial [Blastocatellia bacterium]|nr:RHS repeat-associated core domain-containing protein [Blastocatellia bacterium]
SAIPLDGIPNLAYDTATNRITTSGYQYDVNGNMIRSLAEDGVTWVKYEYDAANRLNIVRKDDANQTQLERYQYDSTNARVQSHDFALDRYKSHLNAGGTAIAEFTEFTVGVPTWTKSYTYLGSSQLSTITPNGQGGEYTEYNHPDRLGTRTITNQAGGTSYEQNTLPYGTALNAESTTQNNNKRFTSYDRSAQTGLDYAINRTYDSKQGRFTQVDPIGIQAASLASPQTLNMYTYCGNDPVNYTDPSGLFWGFFKKLFKWLMKAIKWIAIAVTVAFIVISAVWAPGSTGFIAKLMLGLLDFLSKIGGAMSFASGGLLAATEGIAAWQIGLGAIIAAGAAGAVTEYQTRNRKKKVAQASRKICHWIQAEAGRLSDFFDKLWNKTKETGKEAGGIVGVVWQWSSCSGGWGAADHRNI